jgi:hypothetical protein
VRTTLTIDDDVAKLVEQEVKRSGDSFKGTVNRLLLQGLVESRQAKVRERFVVTPRKMGLPAGLSYDSIPTLLDELDGPFHR